MSDLPGPTDAWITLAGLARETERIRLGTLVTAATFRFIASCDATSRVAGVSVMPGAMAFTRMPNGPSSRAST